MATFGKYEVVTELHAGDRGAVFSARAAGGGREIRYAVKTFNPHALDQDEQFYESQSFVERARVQQQVGTAGGAHWAPIHDTGTSPAGTYYVTDFHPLSAASLVSGRVEVSPGVLYAIVRSVVSGLSELKNVAGRAHGNLKPTNVLINSRGDVAVAGAVLTDPANAADAARVGEAGDLRAVGELIHLLVLGRPYNARSAWPLPPSREWSRLGGRQGRAWRKLCNDLLAPDPSERPHNIEAVGRRLRRLIPRRARPSRRLSLAVAAVVVLIAAGAATVLGMRDAAARREVCAAKTNWAGGLTTALADPKRRTLLQNDPDLKRVVQELDVADLSSFDCERTGGRFTFNPNLRQFRRTQDTLAAVRRAERGLSPIQWRQLARAAELQGRFEARGWTGPARHLAECIAGARPGSNDLAEGIERFLLALGAVDRDLPKVEEKWVALQTQTRKLEDERDPVLKAFARQIRSDAAATVRLTDAGFGSHDGVRDASARAGRLLEVHTRLDNGDYDEERFKDEVVRTIDIKNVKPADIDRWLTSVEGYRVRRQEIRAAVQELTAEQEENERLVRESGIDEKQLKDFEYRLGSVKIYLSQFDSRKYIQRDIDDGTFRTELAKVKAAVASLKGFRRTEDVEVWLANLDAPGVASKELATYWKVRRGHIEEAARRLADQPQELAELQAETRRLGEVLLELDKAVPSVPAQFSRDPDVNKFLVASAEVKREQVLSELVKNRAAQNFAERPDGAAKVREAESVIAAAEGYNRWTDHLRELARDFPLRQALLTPDVRPDEKWAAAQPDFWKDPVVQSFVGIHVERLKRLRGLEGKARDELATVAESDNREELALHAWRLLGREKVEPAWPTRPGELALEAKIRRRLVGLLTRHADTPEGRAAAAELREQAPVRWQRFAVAAGADEQMLASAVALRDAFGVEGAHFSALPPEARFNLSLLEARRHLRDRTDEGLSSVVADLTRAASELKDKGVAAELSRRLARVEEKEPFAGEAEGDEFRMKPAGTDVELVFRRVKPEGGRPFFLGATEVSFAQLEAVVNAASGWDDLLTLVWSPQPGDIGDPRRGPRSWEWAMRPAPRMHPPQWWYFPEDANDFPKEFRDPAVSKFNRTALGEAVGGSPSEQHPVQYVTPEAAMYVAALVGCRLPTAAEWRAAYDGFEKSVPAAEWNLRDQTWATQRDHVAGLRSADGTSPPLPDEGIFLPATPKAATGSAARAHSHSDGTPFFRAAGSGGGATFRQLVGNVAEIVCDAPEGFAVAAAEKHAARIKSFTAEPGHGLYVIGGSALSPPEVPVDTPLALKPGGAYADVGFRLAFTAPSRNLAEKLEWVLAGQGFVQPVTGAKTASAEKPQS